MDVLKAIVITAAIIVAALTLLLVASKFSILLFVIALGVVTYLMLKDLKDNDPP